MERIKGVFSVLANKKTPLILSVLAQAYVIFIWLAGWDKNALNSYLLYLTVAFAVISAVSLDLIVVSTTFSKHHSAWSTLTAIVALLGSVLVVIDLFYHLQWYWLHAVFPLMVFMYSQHLREERSQEEAQNHAKKLADGWTKEELIDIMITLQATNEFIYKVIRGDRTKLWKYITERRQLLIDGSNTQ